MYNCSIVESWETHNYMLILTTWKLSWEFYNSKFLKETHKKTKTTTNMGPGCWTPIKTPLQLFSTNQFYWRRTQIIPVTLALTDMNKKIKMVTTKDTCSTALNQKTFEKIYIYEITKPVEKFGWNVASIVLDKVYI